MDFPAIASPIRALWGCRSSVRPSVASGKRLHNYGKSPCLMGKSPCLMGKSTISTGSFSIANCWHNQRVAPFDAYFLPWRMVHRVRWFSCEGRENQVLNCESMRAYEDWFYADLSPNLLTVESLKWPFWDWQGPRDHILTYFKIF